MPQTATVVGASAVREHSIAWIRELSAVGVVAVQLALVVLVVRAFRIEEAFGFLTLAPLILAGFVVHALLPLRLRLPLFVALGMAAPLLVFGGKHGAALIILALGLIALCHLPIRFGARVALVVLAGVGLALARAQVIATPGAVATVVLPILAAMFMFRLAIYLYDLKHETTPASWWQRLGYFFMLPNICFPLFPVVDYQAFRRTHYDGEAVTIYQKGVLWMLRGVTHILLYRLIYYHLLPAPAEVVGLGSVVAWMLATYGLYLRISGQFHLIVGILCLFGFNLPETHHLYYLASSFNDYWRRINIYWKDFMMKLFYYPALMRLRRWGMTTALVGATIFVFFGTWILHSYQWFWLRGSFPLTGPDALFWGILGALVVVNSLQEAKRGAKRRRLKAAAPTGWGDAFGRAARIVGMFCVITVLWSLWSSPSLGAWVRLLAQAGNATPAEWLLLALGIGALVAIGAALLRAHERGWQLTPLGPKPPFHRAAVYVGVLAFLLLGASRPAVQQRISTAGPLVASLQVEGLNADDETQMDRGYYEGLLEAPRYTSALWTVRAREPDDWDGIHRAGAVRDRDGLLNFELVPSFEGMSKRASFRTNEWGMRDRSYTLAKPPGTHRIALIGASYEMGAGVDEPLILTSLAEDRLNRERAGRPWQTYEILNFAVGGYSILHNTVVASEKVVPFEPDVLLFAIHSTEANRLLSHLVRLLGQRSRLGVGGLDAILADAGVAAGMTWDELQRRLEPRLPELLAWSFAEIASTANASGMTPAMAYVPVTTESPAAADRNAQEILGIARAAGFVTLSLADAFEGQNLKEMQIAPWDTHLSASAHALLADRLYVALLANADVLSLNAAPADDGRIDQISHEGALR